MAKKSKKGKISLVAYDPVETPEEIIAGDKDPARKDAFREAYKKVAAIIPEYFMTKKKKNGSGGASSGGNKFTQSILVTNDKAVIQTNDVVNKDETKEEREIGE